MTLLGEICIIKGFTVPYVWLWCRAATLFIQEERVWGVGWVDWIEFSCWKSLAPSLTPACWLPIVDSAPTGRDGTRLRSILRAPGAKPTLFYFGNHMEPFLSRAFKNKLVGIRNWSPWFEYWKQFTSIFNFNENGNMCSKLGNNQRFTVRISYWVTEWINVWLIDRKTEW